MRSDRRPGEGSFEEHYVSIVDEQIRRATAEGKFDDLPGAGRPLNLPRVDDENWWVRSKMAAEGVPLDALLPPPLQLRKEIAALDDTVRDLPDEAAVRAVVTDLDRRVTAFLRAPVGPRVPVRRPSADAVLARWRAARAVPDTASPSGAGDPTAGGAPTAGPGRRRWWWRPRRES